MLSFLRFLAQSTGIKGAFAIFIQLIATLLEGISILLLIPILSLVNTTQIGQLSLIFPNEPWLGPLGGVEMNLIIVLLALVFMVVFQSAINVYRSYFIASVMTNTLNNFRLSVLKEIVYSNWRFFNEFHKADLNHALTSEIERVQASAAAIISLVQILLTFAIYSLLSFFVSPSMTICAALIGSVILVLLRPVRRLALKHGKSLTHNRQDQFRLISNILEGIKILKTYNIEEYYIAKFDNILRKNRNLLLNFNKISSLSFSSYQILISIGLVSFVYISLIYSQLTLPKLVVMLLIFMRVAPRLISIQNVFQQLLQNIPAFCALQEIKIRFERQRDASYGAGEQVCPDFHDSIELRQVSLIQNGNIGKRFILDSVDVTIMKGKVTAIIGPSGAGKSTIADILLGLLSPTSGSLFIDGRELNSSMMKHWREKIAFVPQDDFLMHSTIAANMRLAKMDATDDEIWCALEKAQARDFVLKLPNQLQEVVGDNGRRLSGGECQRLSLARALLRKPDFLLLDEATSALDWENQLRISNVIRELRENVTILIIAHRPSMIAFADHVVALETGKVVESGNFTELKANPESCLAKMLANEAK